MGFQERVLIVSFLVVCGATLLICVMPQDGRRNLSFVTNGRSLDAVHARLRAEYNYSDREGMDVIAYYADCQFGTFRGSMCGTVLREWLFYDKDDQFLFSLTEIGNWNLVRINIDDKETLYQYRRPEK